MRVLSPAAAEEVNRSRLGGLQAPPSCTDVHTGDAIRRRKRSVFSSYCPKNSKPPTEGKGYGITLTASGPQLKGDTHNCDYNALITETYDSPLIANDLEPFRTPCPCPTTTGASISPEGSPKTSLVPPRVALSQLVPCPPLSPRSSSEEHDEEEDEGDERERGR